MNIESLKTFIILSEQKSFTQTAEKCFVVQSTITNRMMELEKEIGKKLLIRSKKSVELTPEGEKFLPYAKRITELEESAVMEISMMDTFTETLRIGTVNTVYDCHLSPVFASYMRKYPGISVKVTVDHSSVLIGMLQDGILDGIFSFVRVERSGYECVKYKRDTLVLVTGEGNRDYVNGITKAELQNLYYLYCDFVIQEGGNFLRDIFPKNKPFPFEIDKSTKLLSYLLEGIGYSFLPESFAEPYLKSNQLREIELLDFQAPSINSYFITTKPKLGRDSVQRFSELLGLSTGSPL